MKAETKESYPFRKRVKSSEKSLPRRRKGRLIRHVGAEAFRSGDDGEVRELDLERDRPPRDFRALDAGPGITGDALQLARQPVGVAFILVEGPLRAHRLVRSVGLDLALIDPAADPV